MTSESKIQLRPTVRLSIAALPATEQEHARISLRVIGSNLPVPCVAVTSGSADIAMKPVQGSTDKLCLSADGGECYIDRPLRMAPFLDALSALMEHMQAQAQPATSATSARHDLFALLTSANVTTARCVQMASGPDLLVDPSRGLALVAPGSQLEGEIVSSGPLLDSQWAQYAKNPTYVPMSCEQLCWRLPPASVEAGLRQWLGAPDTIMALSTWPNLSQQPDAAQWIELLADLSQAPRTLGQLLARAAALGMPEARAHQGLALLSAFKHAQRQAAGEEVVVQLPTQPRQAQVRSRGILDRLRSRLKAMSGRLAGAA